MIAGFEKCTSLENIQGMSNLFTSSAIGQIFSKRAIINIRHAALPIILGNRSEEFGPSVFPRPSAQF